MRLDPTVTASTVSLLLLLAWLSASFGYALREWRAIDRESIHQRTRRELFNTIELLDEALVAKELAEASETYWRDIARSR